MNRIDEKELLQQLRGFFKSKGIEMKEGAYTQGIQKGCELLADTVNLSQQAFPRAKEQTHRQLDQMRQIIHERTAPKPPPRASNSSRTHSSRPRSAHPRRKRSK